MGDFEVENLSHEEEERVKSSFLKVQKNLVEEVGQLAFKSWLSQLNVVKLKQGILYLSLPTSFLSDWVVPHYGTKIERLCKRFFNNVNKTKIILQKNKKSN